ncbi:MAG: hypothetical protein ACOZFS_08150 [Thermodesulfobacteriota bacterium]
MADVWRARINVAVGIILLVFLFNGCAGRPTTQQMVVSEYMLQQAGFKKWDVNDDTPKRQALQLSTPRGQITTYEMGGKVYHLYNDPNHNALYVGDETAYQNYLSMARGQNLCQRVTGSDNVQFWQCFQEYELRQQKGLER